MKRRAGTRFAPLLYLALAMILAVVTLPSVLRPPPEQQQSSAALNPNAPPDEEAETILQSLKQAASRTAGATGRNGVAVPQTTTTTIMKPTHGRCFGNPPRQTESAYSPLCRAAFTGDNGGSTAKNVTGDEITVAFWHVLGMPAHRGKIEDTPPPDEDGPYRTARVLQRYFNDRYELYGRRLQLWAVEDNGDSDAEQRASAVKQAEQSHAFIATHLSYPFCDEFTRHGLVCFNGNGFQKQVYTDHAPLWWSYQMDTDTADQLAAEYICKKLVDRNADFAGTTLQGKPRIITVVTEHTPNNHFRSSAHIVAITKQICGYTPKNIDFDPAKAEEVAQTIAALRANGTTTVVPEVGLVGMIELFSSSDSNHYEPEWVFVNNYGMDFGDAARLTGSPQMNHVFGLSGWELPQPFQDTDCYRAYKSIDPSTAPDQNFCRLHWIDLEHIVNGIQEAGPDLTPQTFEKGLYSMSALLRKGSRPYAVGGGYGPGDHSFVDDFVEMWWDGNATDPDGGEPGTYRYPQQGKRFRPGDMDDVVRVFKDGVRGYNSP
ncbi:MAG: hypothetical protein V7636_1258 [Actinomycetota bacterium]